MPCPQWPQPQRSAQNDHHVLGKPQIFVQLSFGVSWSERHVPQTHTISYTSKNLKKARNSGLFPRQDPSHHQPRRHDSPQRQHVDDRRSNRADHDRQRGRTGYISRLRRAGAPSPPRNSKLDPRGATSERGSSAPPPIHNDLWNDGQGGSSATLFPRPTRTATAPSHTQKALPALPASFRLGENDLPWSVPPWPYDSDGDGDDDGDPAYPTIPPTILPLSPPNRRHQEDPLLAKELESLSTAMVTVDNGFENQWWNRGQRQSIAFFPPEDNEEHTRRMSMADTALVSAIEPSSPDSEGLRFLVSPLSDVGPTFDDSSRFLHRPSSTRSDELWMVC